jgi:cytoskeletal protein RodZ
MNDLGSELRERREAKDITLEEAATATRIKERYLRALEVNDWAALPTPVQARGFLRNYAVFLGLDGDQVLSKYGQAIQSASVSLPSPSVSESSVRTNEDGVVFRPRDIDIDGGGVPQRLSSDILVGVALALLVAVVGFAVLTLANQGSDGSDSSSDADAVPGLVTSFPQPTGDTGISVDQATPAGPTPTFDASAGTVQLNLEATEHVWVRVTVDNAQVLEGILAPGSPQTWQGSQQIILETANGAGLNAVVNSQPQGQLGERGQAVVLVWGPSGQIAVTLTPSP